MEYSIDLTALSQWLMAALPVAVVVGVARIADIIAKYRINLYWLLLSLAFLLLLLLWPYSYFGWAAMTMAVAYPFLIVYLHKAIEGKR